MNPLERWVNEVLWRGIQQVFTDIALGIEAAANNGLATLRAGQTLIPSPLVKVLAVGPDSITWFMRGPVEIWPRILSAFMRIEVVTSNRVDVRRQWPLEVRHFNTVSGEVRISKPRVVDVDLALGYDRGTWMGRGAMKVHPGGFGLDIFLGGLNERGAMIGLDVDFPAPIPLGATGLGLSGLGGDFAYNFVPRLEDPVGVAVANPDARHYVRWARRHDTGVPHDSPPPTRAPHEPRPAMGIDRWRPGPVDQTAVGLGIRCDLKSLPDNGTALLLAPIGLAILTPGPVVALGGAGKVLLHSIRAEGYVVLDVASGSIAFGLIAQATIGDVETYIVRATGTIEAFFSITQPWAWFLNLGTESEPIRASLLNGMVPEGGHAFLMIDNYRLMFGAGYQVGGDVDLGIIRLILRIGAGFRALIGWNPPQVEAMIRLWGEIGLRIWILTFVLKLEARALGRTPNPTRLEFAVSYTLDLQWPLPDPTGTARVVLGDTPTVGSASSPLTLRPPDAGEAVVGDALGAVHPLSGRQWDLARSESAATPAEEAQLLPWPDLDIVVPFSTRVIDESRTIVAPAQSAIVRGGYEVRHVLESLEVRDLVADEPVPDVRCVWGAVPGGDSARLHVLASDPFTWLTPHPLAAGAAADPSARVVEQSFGTGPDDRIVGERSFGELIVAPAGPGDLVNDFRPDVATRVLRCSHLELRVRTADGAVVAVDELSLIVIAGGWGDEVPPIGERSREIRRLGGALALVEIDVPLARSDSVEIGPADPPLLVVSARYREARATLVDLRPRAVLTPGRYALRLSGATRTIPPDGLPAQAPVEWGVDQSFRVGHPETLRPYIRDTTLGDSRIFSGPSGPAWNPTARGVGFPAYRSYGIAIGFLVPYMSRIFDRLRLSLVFDDGGEVELDAAPTDHPLGRSSLGRASAGWIVARGGTVRPDQEIAFPGGIARSGAATASLWFTPPDGEARKLDEWTCHVSRFDGFRGHVAWRGDSILTAYDGAGRHVRPCCPSPTRAAGARRSAKLSERVVDLKVPSLPAALEEQVALPTVLDRLDLGSLPDELTVPPPDWLLPAEASALVGSRETLDATTATRFARFAAATGARFNEGGAGVDPLDGISDVVASTTIEVAVDGDARPYGLWLRTPEPVDWRRVRGSLRIAHTLPATGCPTSFARRHALELGLGMVPSADATSAFLVGSMRGRWIFLPRGHYELMLTFDHDLPGLELLRPDPRTASPETATLSFVQPWGLDWPLPSAYWFPASVLVDYLIRMIRRRAGAAGPRPAPRTIGRLVDDLMGSSAARVVSWLRRSAQKGGGS